MSVAVHAPTALLPAKRASYRLLAFPAGINAEDQEEQGKLEGEGNQETNVKGDIPNVEVRSGLAREHLEGGCNGGVGLPEVGEDACPDADPPQRRHRSRCLMDRAIGKRLGQDAGHFPPACLLLLL